MKVKTSELTGAALDWAVAKCEYPDALDQDIEVWIQPLPCDDPEDFKFQPSTDWAQGGPIIERERIRLDPRGVWVAGHDSSNDEYPGDTPLIAAMRCFVASKLGDEVDVPDELTREVSL